MTIGEIKIEALRLMFQANIPEMSDDNLADYLGDDTYGYYLTRMAGAINRALGRIERARVASPRRAVLSYPEDEERPVLHGAVIDLTGEEYADVGEVERVEMVGAYGNVYTVDFDMQGTVLRLAHFGKHGTYTMLYVPRYPRISGGTPDTSVIGGLSEQLCEILPFSLVAELYEGDEPDIATRAQARFETALGEMRQERTRERRQSSVATVFGMGVTV